MASTDAHTAPLLLSLNADDGVDVAVRKPEVKVYAARWWVLAVYCLNAATQGWQWGLPGPLSTTFSDIYGVSGDTVQLMLNWGPIMYLPFAIPAAFWLDQRTGLKWATITNIVLVTLGVVLRCFARDASSLSIALLHVGFILNAIAGPVAMGAVSRLAEDWFPVAERGTATAIAAQSNLFGSAIAFIVGPYYVSDNSLGKLMIYNYMGVGLSAFNLVCALAYFPTQPPTPPSVSSAAQAHEGAFTPRKLLASLAQMCRNKNFIILCLAYGITCGMASGWSSTMSLNLGSLNYSQDQAGWISFATVIAGNIGGVVLGKLVDRFRHHKAVICTMLVISCVALAYFTALIQKILPDSWTSGNVGFGQIFAVGTIAGFAINSVVPVYFELSIEATFPLPEATVVMIMTLVNNTGTLILLLVPLDKAAAAFNYVFTAATIAITAGVILFFQEGSKRLQVDLGNATIEDHEEDGAGSGDALLPTASSSSREDGLSLRILQ